MNNEKSTMQAVTGLVQCGSFGMVSLVVCGALLVRMGYSLGLSHAKGLLKQHDKDVRIMNKREKRMDKERRRKEEEEKRDGERTTWSWFKKNKT